MAQPFFYRLILRAMLFTIGLALGVIVISSTAQAQQKTLSLSRNSTPGHVTIMVLDMSGSMTQNDPNGFRCSAANAYIDLSGPGNFIGVIGLDNTNGSRGGTHNFQMSQVWTEPSEMATLSNRQQLEHTIFQRSMNCRPGGTTPTYDALSKALIMLNSATRAGQIAGSVMLLTDGEPSPDTEGQINAINKDLLPQFKNHNWPIDTVALGEDTGFHLFLNDLANATSGKFYDDGRGVVSGVSPLNTIPFLLDIFARRIGRTMPLEIPSTSLNGGTTSRDFQVSNFAASLDVVVVKDLPSTKVTLTAPNGLTIPPVVAGTLVLSDPHYTIFSIIGPQPGNWQLNVKGSGLFLMKSLIVSTLNIAITSSPANSVLPLGQEFTISATISSNSSLIVGGSFNVTGSIVYANDSARFSRIFVLTDSANPGVYQAKMSIPENAPPGSYEITASVSQVSNVPLASANLTFRLELFPTPSFLSPQTNQPTDLTVNYTIVQWDPVLQHVYSLPVNLVQWLGQWPLHNLPPQPNAILIGQVNVQGQPYSNAAVRATATHFGTNDTIPVTVVNDGGGRFHVLLSPLADGTYVVTFQTSGTFEDSHGDFGVTSRPVYLTTRSATISEELYAWAVTGIYIICLFLLNYLFRFYITPRLSGEWECWRDGESVYRHTFNNAHRGLLQTFFQRNLLYSQQVGMPKGLQFRFLHGGRIEVRPNPNSRASADWHYGDGRDLQPQFLEIRELVYHPISNDVDDESIRSTYIIIPRQDRGSSSIDGKSDHDNIPTSRHLIGSPPNSDGDIRTSQRRYSGEKHAQWEDYE